MAFNRWKTREGRRNFSVPLSKPVPDNRYSARSVRSFDPRPAKFSPRLTVKRICSRAPTEFQPLRTPLARFFFEAALRLREVDPRIRDAVLFLSSFFPCALEHISPLDFSY